MDKLQLNFRCLEYSVVWKSIFYFLFVAIIARKLSIIFQICLRFVIRKYIFWFSDNNFEKSNIINKSLRFQNTLQCVLRFQNASYSKTWVYVVILNFNFCLINKLNTFSYHNYLLISYYQIFFLLLLCNVMAFMFASDSLKTLNFFKVSTRIHF